MANERDIGEGPAPGDVGAGTGATARDMGEEGTIEGLDAFPGTSELTEDDAQWGTLAGDQPSGDSAEGTGPRGAEPNPPDAPDA